MTYENVREEISKRNAVRYMFVSTNDNRSVRQRGKSQTGFPQHRTLLYTYSFSTNKNRRMHGQLDTFQVLHRSSQESAGFFGFWHLRSLYVVLKYGVQHIFQPFSDKINSLNVACIAKKLKSFPGWNKLSAFTHMAASAFNYQLLLVLASLFEFFLLHDVREEMPRFIKVLGVRQYQHIYGVSAVRVREIPAVTIYCTYYSSSTNKNNLHGQLHTFQVLHRPPHQGSALPAGRFHGQLLASPSVRSVPMNHALL